MTPLSQCLANPQTRAPPSPPKSSIEEDFSELEKEIHASHSSPKNIDSGYLLEMLALVGRAKTVEDLEVCCGDAISKGFGIEGVHVKIFKSPADAENYSSTTHVMSIRGNVHNVCYNIAAIEYPDATSAMMITQHPIFKTFLDNLTSTIATRLGLWIDMTTGLYSEDYRFGFMEKRGPFDEAMKKGYGVIMIDVDHFKYINDNFGHPKGDETLKKIGDAIIDSVRDEDLPIRRGGGADEILVYATGCSADEMISICERLRQTIGNYSIAGKKLTISIGYVHSSELNTVGSQRITMRLTEIAEERMYASKDRGGDKITGPDNSTFKMLGKNYLARAVIIRDRTIPTSRLV